VIESENKPMNHQIEELEKQLAAVTMERDNATAERDALRQQINIVTAERDQAQAACAEMRINVEALICGGCEYSAGYTLVPTPDLDELIKASRSTTCGTGWVRKEDVKPLRDAAQMALNWFETGPADFQVAAEKVAPALDEAIKQLGLTD
jgi:hypothetical protein